MSAAGAGPPGGRARRPDRTWGLGSIVLGGVVLASLIYGGVHFQRGLPFASFGVHDGKTTYDWLVLPGDQVGLRGRLGPVELLGLRGQGRLRRVPRVVDTMKKIGEERGCGRALWEHQTGDDSSYGTPMALMLLPFWTDGCIGSMEGLYFEASGTTPYHFLTAAAGSSRLQPGAPAGLRRQRRRPGRPLHAGPRHPLLPGLPPGGRGTGRRQPGPHPDRQVGPWKVYEVAGSDLVVPLTTDPVVVDGTDNGLLPLHLGNESDRWLELGTCWFQHPEDWAALPAATAGRLAAGEAVDRRAP